MGYAIRKGDKDDGNHTVTGSAAKVFIVGQLAARQGDDVSGGYKIAGGSGKVTIEGAPAAREGDPTTKAGDPTYHLVAGQTKVNIG